MLVHPAWDGDVLMIVLLSSPNMLLAVAPNGAACDDSPFGCADGDILLNSNV